MIEIAPLLKKRWLFAESSNFLLYDFFEPSGSVEENVFAYSNCRRWTRTDWWSTTIAMARRMEPWTGLRLMRIKAVRNCGSGVCGMVWTERRTGTDCCVERFVDGVGVSAAGE